MTISTKCKVFLAAPSETRYFSALLPGIPALYQYYQDKIRGKIEQLRYVKNLKKV